MKSILSLLPGYSSSLTTASACSCLGWYRWVLGFGSCLTATTIAIVPMQTSWAAPTADSKLIAQALPTPLPPLPTNGGTAPTTTGEQYLVLVNGNSDSLLQQVRQVEPGAFVNYVEGRSVIQAGRFSSFQNAQVRADELANFGIGAEVQTTDYSGAPIAVTPDYDLAFPAPAQTALPNSPTGGVAATPAAIEFGQAAPFQTAVPTTAAAFPPAPPTSTYPSSGAPPLNAPAIVNESLPSGYYVVVPGGVSELQSIVNRVVALGAPSSLVRARTAPRGPHVAVGPYNDHGIAQEWTNYLRDSGVAGARVHFE